MGHGRDSEAVEVVTAHNGTTSNLTLDRIRRADRNLLVPINDDSEQSKISAMDTSRLGALHRILWLGPHNAAILNTETCLVYEGICHSMGYSILAFDVTACTRLTYFLAFIGLAFPP